MKNVKSLSIAELEAVPQILDVLQPFVDATTELSGGSYVTLSLVIPTVKQILISLHEKVAKNEVNKILPFVKDLTELTKTKLLKYEGRSAPR